MLGGTYSVVMFSLAAAFSVNLNNPAYFVDLPCDDEGQLRAEIWSQWLAEDPSFILAAKDTAQQIGLYFDACRDAGGLPAINQAFAASLNQHCWPYRFELFRAATTIVICRSVTDVAPLPGLPAESCHEQVLLA